ncbi:hypothetical protein M0812_27480 [Anaeramoeba flamelloides]|uniref:Reverse transcriptase domain-containing protein n=1 Tax=Anaeramoeba flamelloides TaxID=1746091 RepID=A0AAV7Y5K9_9EUKA|nr:hypothetical protein M0812_27480 [Anaeramoeba flamelloides]
MFADDLILLMKGSLIEINFQLQKIFKIIKDFGMNPNDDKTKKTLIPKEILYLGIWLDKKTHLKFNLDKVKANFKKLINILQQKNFSNGLKIQFFKAKKESENINWYSKNLKQLENELENFRIKNLENSPSWKVQEYLKIVQINNTINKQQRYLKWKGSTSILKLRNLTNYLNRYSYVMNKNKSKLCELCKKINNLDIIEDLDHFLWNCSAYENNRKIWISELKKINISNILNNNNISNIIIKKDSNSLLALVGNKLIFESLIKFLNKNLGIRANKRGQ